MEPYYVINLHEITHAYNLWRSHLHEVDVYYAMKCNPSPCILEHMNRLGIRYDCASKQEIIDALQYTPSENIVYANPCKFPSHIQYAQEVGVSLTVVDCECEMHKMKELYPTSSLLLRIAVDDTTSQCSLSKKFGCSMNEVHSLLLLAQELDLRLVGFSFHVGSGCTQPTLYHDALQHCFSATMMAEVLGFHIEIIDIGGGFTHDNFIECAEQVRRGMSYFTGKKFISEVGRFLVEKTHTLHVHVICKKRSTKRIYYLDDGLYGSMNCKLFDHAKPVFRVNKDGPLFESTLYGPTCDSFDLVEETILLPELEVGDELYIENFGAYTSASASSFNGYTVSIRNYI